MDALYLPKGGQKKLRFRRLKPKIFVSLSSFVILAALFAWYFSPLNFLQVHAADLNGMSGQVPSIVKKSTVVSATDPNTPITVSVGLRLRNQADLAQYIKSTTEGKDRIRRALTSDQLIAAYAPLPSSEKAVIAYMQQAGFRTTKTYNHHLLITFTGTVAQAQQAFHVQINNYRSPAGEKFYAPAADPVVPGTLAPFIQSITGLDTANHLTHSLLSASKQLHTQVQGAVTPNAVTCIPDSTNGTYFTPSQLANIYNLASLQSSGLKGDGETVGLVEFADFSDSDVQTYTGCYGQSATPITRVTVDNGATLGAGSIEADLDIELILGQAPHLASLRVYEAPNSDQGSIDMWSQIVQDKVPVVSTSWGNCEDQLTTGVAQQENNLFMMAAAQGQSIVASSGDTGSTDCVDNNGNAINTLSVDDPAAQPFVTGVGGTTLKANGSAYGSETVWNNAPTRPIASGGGLSHIWTIPTWQAASGVPGQFNNNHREVPDVSLDADPNTGYPFFCSVAASGCDATQFGRVGGTSAAAPMWAVLATLANQKAHAAGLASIGFLNPLLYGFIQDGLSQAPPYSNDFHDVTSGNNNIFGNQQYPAAAGYDMATGLGSYNAANLVSDLVNLAAFKPAVPANLTWYFPEGSVGNSFSEFITVLNPDATKQANVSITYLFQDKVSKTVNHSVPANSRGTFSANDDLGIPASSPNQEAISLIVASDIPIVAERPMYFNFLGVASGTDVLGATHIDQTTFYFAAGDERQDSTRNYQTFVTILNPSTSQTATVTATYYAQGNVVGTKTIQVGPMKRGTTSPADLNIHQQVAIKVTSDIGIVVERPLYFHDNIATAGGNTTGASSAVGANKLGNDWLFAEGFTGQGFQEFIVLANFTTSATTAHVKLEYLNGQVQDVPVSVPAQSQVYFDVNNANQHPNCSCQVTASHSTDVTDADSAIVAERLMFFHFGAAGLSGGSDAVGEIGPASHSTYSFAEGFTIGNWAEFITLQNPTSSSEQVVVTLYTDHAVVEKLVQLPAFSRTTVDVNPIAVPIAQAYPGAGAFEVSASVQALNGGVVVAERPLYFQFGSPPSASDGGSSILGYTGG